MEKIIYKDFGGQVYEKLKSMILSGVFTPGEKIPQEELAEKLGVSKAPILKAFQLLENELLVETKPRRDVFVKKLNMEEIGHAFDCRGV